MSGLQFGPDLQCRVTETRAEAAGRAWQFGGEACVIDCRDLVDTTPNGRSDLVKKERVKGSIQAVYDELKK